jgi:small subunit ribosomal protein S20
MPQRKAQSKSLRQTRRRTLVNKARKTRMRTATRQAREAAMGRGDLSPEQAFSQAQSAIDKAVKRGVIRRQAADRRKARLAARMKALSSEQ